MQPDAPGLYPAFLKLAGLPVVVVGGGAVAASKLEGLVGAGARITVIAPAISDAIRTRSATIRTRSAASPSTLPSTLPTTLPITLIERGFAASDLDGARWVVAAATPEVNREVATAAAERGLFVNAVDDLASASAYLGGVVRRGPVLLAISTAGLAPALAGLVREALEAVLPDDLERWIDVAVAARADWKRAGTPIALRRPLLLRALDRIYWRITERGTERTERVFEPATERGTERGIERISEPATERGTERDIERISEPATERGTERGIERISEPATECGTERGIERISEPATERGIERISEPAPERARELRHDHASDGATA